MIAHSPTPLALVGGGPSALSLAARAAELGIDNVVVGPTPHAPWIPTWAGFADELPASIPVRHRWEFVRVALPGGEIRRGRPYVEVDTPRLQSMLTEAAGRTTFIDATVLGLSNGQLETSAGRLTAEHIIDCTGIAQVCSAPGRKGPTAFQTAFGLEIETDGHPWPADTATWMDLTDLDEQPSFLYVLPRDPHTVFVEETALAARPAMALEVLEQRLHKRLEGITIRRVLRTERCVIPLDMPLPTALSFGVAAGMVHPSTGYLLNRVLHRAPAFLDRVLAHDDAGARALCTSAARGLHLYGLDVLTRMDGPALAGFFEDFFASGPTNVDAFVGRDDSLRTTVPTMLRFFLGASNRTRYRLLPSFH